MSAIRGDIGTMYASVFSSNVASSIVEVFSKSRRSTALKPKTAWRHYLSNNQGGAYGVPLRITFDEMTRRYENQSFR